MNCSDEKVDAAVDAASEEQVSSQGITDIAQTTLVKSIIKLAIKFGGNVARLLYEALSKLIEGTQTDEETPDKKD